MEKEEKKVISNENKLKKVPLHYADINIHITTVSTKFNTFYGKQVVLPVA